MTRNGLRKYIRNNDAMVSAPNNRILRRINVIDALYHGGFLSYEDPADHVHIRHTKGARIA